MSITLKKDIAKGFFWSIFGQLGYLIVIFISNIILARLLSPYEFGQFGIVMFFIVIAKVLTESGLAGSLIRKKGASEEDFSTVFIFNLVISVFLMVLLMAFAGHIADFYNDPALKNILIALSFIPLINAFRITQTVKLIKNLSFKRKAVYEFITISIASIIGIIAAIEGAGTWAIVSIQLVSAFLLTVSMWIFEVSIKKYVFSKESFLALYKFGVNTTGANLLNTAFDNIYQLILGKYFSINQTGVFYQAKKLQEIPVGLIKSTTLGVAFSSLSKLQDDMEAFGSFYNRIVTAFSVMTGLICILIYSYSENIILVLYGEQWIGAVFYMKVLIIASFFYMQEIFNRIVFKVFDKTEKILHLEFLKKGIQSITIVFGIYYKDIDLLIYGFLATNIISYFINYYYSMKVFSGLTWKGMLLVIKVINAMAITIAVINLTIHFLKVEGYYTFLAAPLLIVIYFVILKKMNVLDIVKDFSIIINLLKNKNV